MPDDWAECLPAKQEELAGIVAAGLRRRKRSARQEIHHLADIVETLAELPSAEEVLALRPSPALSGRITCLLDKKRHSGLTPEGAAENGPAFQRRVSEPKELVRPEDGSEQGAFSVVPLGRESLFSPPRR